MYAEDMMQDLADENERQEQLIADYKEGIKELAEAEERVALLFDTYVERRESW